MRYVLKSVVVCVFLLSAIAHADVSLWDKIFGSAGGASPDQGQGVATPMLAPSELGLDAASTPGSAAAPAASSGYVLAPVTDYRLGPGGHLSISVFNEKELTIDAHVSDAGTLSYPFLGDVRVEGMTTGQLKDYLTEQLANGYLVNPQVYVSILEYRQFFVNGEIGKPGGYPYVPGLTVRKAIALAGGFTARASYTKISVIHEQDPFGLPRQTSLNSILLPGDIITVDQSFF